MNKIKYTRIKWCDALKGFAIILVVAGHIADAYIDANLFSNDKYILNMLYKIIYSFHMPLFFIISGYLFSYAYILENMQIKKNNIKKQLINIFILFTLFSVLQWIIKYIFKDFVNNEWNVADLLKMYTKPMPPYWFLYDLFFFYIFGIIIYKRNLKIVSSILVFLLFILSFFNVSTEFDSIYMLPRFAFFFYFGMCFEKFNINYKKIIVLLILMVSTIIVYDCLPVEFKSFIWIFRALFISIIVIYVFMKFKYLYNSQMLNLIGKYSLEIFLIHLFITAPNRIILIKLGINNIFLNFVINLVLAIMLPILIAVICKKIKIYDFIFRPGKILGDKLLKKE